MGQLVIQLKQHTPLWHFQAEEFGCCLRASEVKSKLDQFFFKKKGKKTLDYKMCFKANEDQKVLISDTFTNEKGKKVNKYPIYFGNMGESHKEQKKLVYYKGDIDMYLFSLDTDLLQDIKKLLPEFFACTSFGTRQDKGFGFFYPKEEKEFNSNGAFYCFDVYIPELLRTEEKKFVEVFKYIEAFHKMIRSGVNIPNKKYPERAVYYKSFMYHYAKVMKTNWDKPIIRHHFQLYNNVYKDLCGLRSDNGARKEMKMAYPELEELRRREYANSRWLFRDVLGLASTQEWKAYKDTITIEGKATIAIEGKTEDKVIAIKRFKSPITYRPFPMGDGKFRVYIYLSPIPKTYLDATFTIKSSSGQPPMDEMKLYKDFSLEGYLDYVIGYCLDPGLIAGAGYNKYIDKLFVPNKNFKLNFRKLKK